MFVAACGGSPLCIGPHGRTQAQRGIEQSLFAQRCSDDEERTCPGKLSWAGARVGGGKPFHDADAVFARRWPSRLRTRVLWGTGLSPPNVKTSRTTANWLDFFANRRSDEKLRNGSWWTTPRGSLGRRETAAGEPSLSSISPSSHLAHK